MSTVRSSVLVLLLTVVVLSAAGCGSAAVTTKAPGTATPSTPPTAAPSLATIEVPGDIPSDPGGSSTSSPVETAMQYVQRVDAPLARVNGQEIAWEY